MGFPLEDKTNNARPPITEYSRPDFWRGVIDGDGSLGIRKAGPYLNLTTKSELLKEAFVNLVKELTGFQMNVSRNKRDNIYNLTICAQKAKIVAEWIYGNNEDLCLQRKYENYLKIEEYCEMHSFKSLKVWTHEEEEYIKKHSIQESMEFLGRTRSSIKGKIERMKKKGEW